MNTEPGRPFYGTTDERFAGKPRLTGRSGPGQGGSPIQLRVIKVARPGRRSGEGFSGVVGDFLEGDVRDRSVAVQLHLSGLFVDCQDLDWAFPLAFSQDVGLLFLRRFAGNLHF